MTPRGCLQCSLAALIILLAVGCQGLSRPVQDTPPPAEQVRESVDNKSGARKPIAQGAQGEPEIRSTPTAGEFQGFGGAETPSGGEVPVDGAEGETSASLQTVYFAYDSEQIEAEAQGVLQANAEWLRANPATKVLIEGHCDERGSVEYNNALGQRRADSVRQYLIDLGIAPTRLETKTWGKLKPADPSSSEDAHAKNRRAEFVKF